MAPSEFWGCTVKELFWFLGAKLDESIRAKAGPTASKFKLRESELDALAEMIAEAKRQDAKAPEIKPGIGV